MTDHQRAKPITAGCRVMIINAHPTYRHCVGLIGTAVCWSRENPGAWKTDITEPITSIIIAADPRHLLRIDDSDPDAEIERDKELEVS